MHHFHSQCAQLNSTNHHLGEFSSAVSLLLSHWLRWWEFCWDGNPNLTLYVKLINSWWHDIMSRPLYQCWSSMYQASTLVSRTLTDLYNLKQYHLCTSSSLVGNCAWYQHCYQGPYQTGMNYELKQCQVCTSTIVVGTGAWYQHWYQGPYQAGMIWSNTSFVPRLVW
jgi:hypothetical protein